MDKQREKLVELIRKAHKVCKAYKSCHDCPRYGYGSDCVYLFFADHLIANGVTVQEPQKPIEHKLTGCGIKIGNVFWGQRNHCL